MAKAVNTPGDVPDGISPDERAPREAAAEFVKSPVGKALDVLTALCAPGGPHRLGTLAARTGLAKPTVHRLLRTLADGGYAQPAPGGRYRPGPRLLGLAAVTLDGSDLVRAARPALAELRRRTGLTAQLFVPDGEFVLLVAQERVESGLAAHVPLGSRLPAHAHAAGLAVLAAGGVPSIPGPAAIRGRAQTLVARAAEHGYAVDDGVAEPDARALAAAVTDADGGVAGAVAVTGPAFTLPPDAAETYGPMVRSAARQMDSALAARAAAPLSVPTQEPR